MNIYLKWADQNFSNQAEIPIFDLKITQEENTFAKADLTLEAGVSLPPATTEGLIRGENQDLFFKGRLVGAPVHIGGDFAGIQLIAFPADFKEKIRALQQDGRIPPFWDPLWIPPEKYENFEEIQDRRPASLYCDRKTGDLSLSDWFEGRQSLRFAENFFADSLKFKLIRAPLQSCTVTVQASWIQEETGVTNLAPAIRKAFPRAKVNTFTKNALLKNWPVSGKKLGRSGYWIVKSKLKPVTPSPLYPAYSQAIPLREEGEDSKPYRVKRHWFKPTLWVGWRVRQRRKETLSLTLHHAFQPLFPGEGPHKTVTFRLQNINPGSHSYAWQPNIFYRRGTKAYTKQGLYTCLAAHTSSLEFKKDHQLWAFKKPFHTPLGHPARASFFLTERGYKAAEHAMEIAKVELAQSARCFEVSFEAPWEHLKEVTTDTSLTLSDPRLPGGKVTGKVTAYTLHAKGETGERIGHVTFLCAVGKGNNTPQEGPATPQYGAEDYGEKDYQVYENSVCQTPSGLSYFRYDGQQPPPSLSMGRWIRSVELMHGPQAQEADIQQCTHQSPAHLQKTLSQKPTHLRLVLKDLRTKETLDV